jgi:hypothetical protein
MRMKETGVVEWTEEEHGGKQPASRQGVNMRKLLKQVMREARGCVDGMMRILQGPKQSSTTGMALKALRGY